MYNRRVPTLFNSWSYEYLETDDIEEKKESDFINSIPPELIKSILAYLTEGSDRKGATLVCRKWKNYIREHEKIYTKELIDSLYSYIQSKADQELCSIANELKENFTQLLSHADERPSACYHIQEKIYEAIYKAFSLSCIPPDNMEQLPSSLQKKMTLLSSLLHIYHTELAFILAKNNKDLCLAAARIFFEKTPAINREIELIEFLDFISIQWLFKHSSRNLQLGQLYKEFEKLKVNIPSLLAVVGGEMPVPLYLTYLPLPVVNLERFDMQTWLEREGNPSEFYHASKYKVAYRASFTLLGLIFCLFFGAWVFSSEIEEPIEQHKFKMVWGSQFFFLLYLLLDHLSQHSAIPLQHDRTKFIIALLCKSLGMQFLAPVAQSYPKLAYLTVNSILIPYGGYRLMRLTQLFQRIRANAHPLLPV